MTYQVLARKWRPQDFASLVGQEHVVTALSNALVERRIAQAYVFSGIRGVGKTTAARVFAKALNCEKKPGSEERPKADPCNACRPCREITSGADIDVLEVDAATHSKVEQVRELTESLRYGAAHNRYKIVVLDEVHRLSRQAFDALLKIVEEPPPHLVFIFATTELDAVPATVLSRCQEFQFRRVPSPVLAQHLGRIAEAEKIEVGEASLRMIARAGEGSVRDSVALLDQLATFGGGAISDEDASRLLGGLDAEIFRRLTAGILAGEHAAITSIVGEIEENGWDPQNVYSQFLGYLRDALHLALGGPPAAVDLPLEEAEALAELVRGVHHESFLQLIQLLLEGEMTVRHSEFGLLALEITWLRAAELPKITRLEDLLSGRASIQVPREIVASAAHPAPLSVTPAPVAAPVIAAPSSPAPVGKVERPAPSTNTDQTVQRLRELLSSQRPSLAARLKSVQLVFSDGKLLIKSSDAALKKALEDGKPNAKVLSQALSEAVEDGALYEVVPDEANAEPSTAKSGQTAASSVPAARASAPPVFTPPPVAAPPAPRRDDPMWDKATADPRVRAVLDYFPGNIKSVEKRTQESDP